MNCAECRDEMVAWAEGCLNPGDERQCQAHLQTCAACRAEYEAVARLQQRLLRAVRPPPGWTWSDRSGSAFVGKQSNQKEKQL